MGAAVAMHAQPPAHMHRAGRKQHQAQRTSTRPAAPDAAFAGGAHHAFGQVQPDQQAEPAVGVHAKRSRPASGKRQRQHLQRQGAVAGRRQPQLPRQAEHDQRQQAATATARRRNGGVGRSGRSAVAVSHGWHHSAMVSRTCPLRRWRAAMAEPLRRTARDDADLALARHRCAPCASAFARTIWASPRAA